MALKKSDIRAILKNEDSTSEEKLADILNILHEEVDAVKDERDSFKTDLDNAKAEIKDLKASNESSVDKWKEKYEKVNTEFETYKTEQSQKETRTAQEKAFVKALKEAGVSEKMIGVITDTKKADGLINSIALDEEGKVTGLDELNTQIKTDYADYISTNETKGAQTSNPPANSTQKTYTRADIAGMSREEINANWNEISKSLSNKGE